MPIARDDLDRIYDHYAVKRGTQSAAEKVLDGIYDTIFKSLRQHPHMGRPVKSHNIDMRLFLSDRSHWIFYNSDKTYLFIYRILAAKEVTEFDYFA